MVKKVKLEVVSVNFVKENVGSFNFEGEGIYRFSVGGLRSKECEKISNENNIEVMEEEDILDYMVNEDSCEDDVNKLKEFVYSDFDNKGYMCVFGEDVYEEYYYIK
jgi:hypothetical protein